MSRRKLIALNLVQLPLSLLGILFIVGMASKYRDTQASPVPESASTSPAANAAPVDPMSPADPRDKVMYRMSFSIIQVISPGRALVTEPDGEQAYLLIGIPSELVDDDKWTGWVFEGEHYQYTTAQDVTKTVRSYIVSTNQNPRNVEQKTVYILNGNSPITKITVSSQPGKER